MGDILAMNSYEAVLRFIELAVEKRGWTQSRLAKEMGMSDSWVSRVLSGDIELSVPMLLKVAETLMIAPAYLLPIIEDQNKEGSGEPMTFEDYCRKIIKEMIKEEVEKALSQK
ncbi:MAG: helix-turn-helix domain-containing protein [Candidatus Aminicenantes bacterium]|nr:helix-turn-helix domain-containing protein [Candidatus Aminicenantes bacterium]